MTRKRGYQVWIPDDKLITEWENNRRTNAHLLYTEKVGKKPYYAEEESFGSDVGNVLFINIPRRPDVTVEEVIDEAQPVKNALAVLSAKTRLLNGRTHLISTVGESRRHLYVALLNHYEVCEEIGIPEESVIFCLERQHKAIAVDIHGVNRFADDRFEVLDYMGSNVEKIMFTGHGDMKIPKLTEQEAREKGIILAKSWGDIFKLPYPHRRMAE